MRITQTFRPIILKNTFYGICAKCGKKCQKTIKVEGTVNPYNKNEDGSIRTSQEVEKRLSVEYYKKAAAWKENPICKKCSESKL